MSCSMSLMYAGYPSPSPPPISPPAYPPLPPDPPGNPPYPPYPPFSPPGNCSAGYEYNPESMVNGGCMIVVAAWVVYVLLGCGCCCCFALCCGCCYKADSICPAERRPTAMMRRSTALAPLHNRASQFAAAANKRRSSLMRRGSQPEKEATPAEAPRPLKITDSMFDKVHPCQMAALEAEAAKEAGALPVVQPNDPTHSLMFKGSASDRAEAQKAYAERLHAEKKAADDARHAERKRAALEKVAERKRERAAAGQGLQSKRRAAEGEDGALEA